MKMSNKNMNRRAKVSAERMQLPKPEGRILKVHTRYKGKSGQINQVPELVLKGDWLAELGFQCGELVKLVTAGPYLHIIRMVTANEQAKMGRLR